MTTIGNFNKLSLLADINLDTHCISSDLEKSKKYSKSLRTFINVITFGLYGAYLKNQMIAVAKKIADVISHKTELTSAGIREADISKVEELSKKLSGKLKDSRHSKAYQILSKVLSPEKKAVEKPAAQMKVETENPPKPTEKKEVKKAPTETKEISKVPEPPRKEVPLSIQKVHPYPGDLSDTDSTIRTTLFGIGNDHTLYLSCSLTPGFDVTIRNQNIFESGAQVIVNAANTHLGGGAGIDGAIHKFGGVPYAKAHGDLKKKYQGKYVEGFAEIISSGNLKDSGIENVIVVAGPQGSSNKQKESELYSCYYNSLQLAHVNNKTSIAFPSISTGLFGFPKDRAAAISTRAIKDFMLTYPHSQLKTISIHFLDDESLATYLFP